MKLAPRNILDGRRDIEDIQGLSIIKDVTWDEKESLWFIKIKMDIAEISEELTLKRTNWYITIDETYPDGEVKIYPATDNGVCYTYPHQSYNSYTEGKLWRNGSPCLETDNIKLNRGKSFENFFSAYEKIEWYCKRLRHWIILASKDELQSNGDYFELPIFPSDNYKMVVFNESPNTYAKWIKSKSVFGRATFHNMKSKKEVTLVKDMLTEKGKIRRGINWGNIIEENSEIDGAWLLLKSVPIINHWTVPNTYNELNEICKKQGINLLSIMEQIAKKFRDGKRHILLIGFPIPNKIGEDNMQIHWQSLILPLFSYGKLPYKGFMNKEKSYWLKDKINIFKNDKKLEWIMSKNWNEDTLLSRGRIDKRIIDSKIIVIGCGSLGGTISENLVRAGVKNITLADGDSFQSGNIARHNLTLENLSKKKVIALSERLSFCNPNTIINYIDYDIGNNRFEKVDLNKYDIIIDCTGSDELIRYIDRYEFKNNSKFISISVSKGAKRLYLYSCISNNISYEKFIKELNKYQLNEIENIDTVREGVGCWHPVFPAKGYEMNLMSSIAIEYIEDLIKYNTISELGSFSIYEKLYSDNRFIGINKL